MKTLEKLDAPIMGLNGQALVDERGSVVIVSRIIANALAGGQSKDPAHAMKLAFQFFDCPTVLEIENDDFILVRDTVASAQLPNITKVVVQAVLNGTEPD